MRRRWALVGAVALAAVLVALAVAAARPDHAGTPAGAASSSAPDPADSPARLHVEVACDFAGKAEEASAAPELQERARYAVAVLLLDQAIIESARAADLDPGLDALDAALQAAHAAGHESDDGGWDRAVRAARAECQTALG